jgi:hypothetical protein
MQKIFSQDSFDFCYVILHKNTTHCGAYKEDFQRWEQFDLTHAYISLGLTGDTIFSTFFFTFHSVFSLKLTFLTFITVRIPNMATAASANEAGYNFTTKLHKTMSYFHVLDTIGFLDNKGSGELSQKAYYEEKFFLPFQVSYF